MELGLAGKAVLVTGGSKGIGKATAHVMAAEGARVIICSRSAAALDDAAAAIRSDTGKGVEIVAADLSSLDGVTRRRGGRARLGGSTSSSTMPGPSRAATSCAFPMTSG